MMGLTFKENCPDLRNTKVVDVVRELKDYGIHVDVHNPWVNSEAAQVEYGLSLLEKTEVGAYDGVVLAVAHETFLKDGAASARRFGRDDHILSDLKNAFRAGARICGCRDFA